MVGLEGKKLEERLGGLMRTCVYCDRRHGPPTRESESKALAGQ
jgi:hypothetical protein